MKRVPWKWLHRGGTKERMPGEGAVEKALKRLPREGTMERKHREGKCFALRRKARGDEA